MSMIPYDPSAPPIGYLPPGRVTEAMLIDMTDTSRRIVFTYMPESFTEQKAANYANVEILGRSEPIMGYSSSGPRLFNITLTFLAHGEDPIEKEILTPVRLLRSWLYPVYISQESGAPSTGVSVPPRVLFVVGSWLLQRCILLALNIEYSGPWMRGDIDFQSVPPPEPTQSLVTEIPGQSTPPTAAEIVQLPDSMIPMIVRCNLTLQECNENTATSPFDSNQVREGGDLIKIKL